MFKKNLQKVLIALGLMDKAKSKTLSKEDWTKIQASYKETFGRDFYTDANEDSEDAAKAKAYDHAMGIISSAEVDTDEEDENDEEEEEITSELDNEEEEEEEEEENPKKKAKNLGKKIEKIVNTNKKLANQVKSLSSKASLDQPIEVKKGAVVGLGGFHTPKFAFGIEHPLFAAEKRWNQILMHGKNISLKSDPDNEVFEDFQKEFKSYARDLSKRMQSLHTTGLLNVKSLNTDGSIDYSGLADAGLGSQYLVRRQDALIARIIALPTVFDVFPLRSNVQDGDLITNAFFGEFSQAYQEGEISKGGMDLVPEKAKVHDVMFKTLFKSMKWIETQYIGYLNTAGSDPVKWNMIEWMVLNIAIVLNNERNVRTVLGHRVEPTAGVKGHYLHSSTGVIHRLLSYIESFQVLPFDDSDYATYSATTMCSVAEAFAEEVNQVLDNLLGKAIYMNEKHRPWYLQSYRSTYGKDLDFTGPNEMKLMNYDLPIIWVPNMGNLKFMWITEIGNIQALENVPGEMYNTYFERRLENVWGFSTWKEGTAAAYAGKKYATAAALAAAGRKEQVIFINKPVTVLAKDATTADGSKNFWFVTQANTADVAPANLELTDITNPEEGVVYKIEVGSADNPQHIMKAEKFSLITDDWEPTAVGAWIKFIYRKSDGKFLEVARS
jgi:hypothetical protein